MPILNLNYRPFSQAQRFQSEALWPILLIAQLFVLVYQLALYGFDFDWLHFGLVTLYVQWQVLLIWLVSQIFWTYFTFQSMPFWQWLFVISIFGCLILIYNMAVSYFFLNLALFDFSFVLKNTALSGLLIGILLYLNLLQQRLQMQQQEKLKQELVLLQSKIRPHFLFNTLNSIAALIPQAPDKAEQLIVDLSALIRWSIHHHEPETTIRNEWNLCQHYLSIESCRLGDKLQWHVDFSELNDMCMIPLFSLQLLIENAIYHGIQLLIGEGTIEVIGRSAEGKIKLIVRNTSPANKQPHQGQKIAINNLKQRLQRLYGNQSDIQFLQSPNQFEATLIYPLRQGEACIF